MPSKNASAAEAEHRPFLAQIRRRDLDSLPSDLNAVQATIDSPGWKLIWELVDQTHEDATRRLLFSHVGAEGRVLEQAEYARLTGFLAGITQARVAAESLIAYAQRHQED